MRAGPPVPWGRGDGDAQPPAMRQGVPQHPGAAAYGPYVPCGNAKALKECVYGL